MIVDAAGSVICMSKCEKLQPRPNSHFSSFASAPCSFKRFTAYSAAALCAGDPVTRAPITSVSWNNVSITFELFRASCFKR